MRHFIFLYIVSSPFRSSIEFSPRLLYLIIYFLYNKPGLAPLCENMPSGKATKPGDVVTAKNGKTIQVGEHMMKCETVKLLSVI